jgi:sulfite reductase alpha subunit-like flavoprotein
VIAIIYVCGDSGKMEPSVRRTPIDLHRAKTTGDEAAKAGMESFGKYRTATSSTCG